MQRPACAGLINGPVAFRINVSPPLTITNELIDEIIDILDKAIGEAEQKFKVDPISWTGLGHY